MRIIAIILSVIVALAVLFLGAKAWRESETVTVAPDDPSSLPAPSKNGPHPNL